MAEGLSFESFAGEIDVCEDTLYEWANKHPEFSEAKKRAFPKNRLWWEKAGRGGLWGTKNEVFNSTVWIFNMKNRHGWRDRVEVENKNIELTLNYSLDESDDAS